MPGPQGPQTGEFMQLRWTLDETTPSAIIEGTVRDWVINDTQAAVMKRNAYLQGGSARVEGIKDFTGTCNGDGGTPFLMPGDIFYFEGYACPDSGVYNTNGIIYHGNAIVNSITINWDFTENGELTYSMEFAGAQSSQDLSGGNLTTVGREGAGTASCLEWYEGIIPHPPVGCPQGSMCGLLFEYSFDDCANHLTDNVTGSTWAEWVNITNASLTLARTNPTTANSGSACCTERSRGPFDWTLTATETEQYPLAAKGTVLGLRLYTSPTEWWLLRHGFYVQSQGITADKYNGNYVTKQAQIAMQGCCTDGTTSRIGQIALPRHTANISAGGYPSVPADVIWPDGYTPPA